MSDPEPLSVVVVTHERDELLAAAVESVERAMAEFDGECEFVVVDSSDRPTLDEADHPMRLLHRPTENAAATKRNTGLAAATHDWVVFMDDDCEMVPDALSTISRAVADAGPDVSGLFGVTEFAGPRSLWFDAFDGTDFMTDFEWAADGGQVDWGPTSIAVFRRSALDAVDGFSEFGTRAGGEDVDLCLRLRWSGTELHAIPAVLVHHTTRTWNHPRPNFTRAFRYGFAEAELLARHPENSRVVRLPKVVLACSLLAVAVSPAAGLLRVPVAAAALVAVGLSWFVGGAAVDRHRYHDGVAEALVLSAYRRAYGLGSIWCALRYGPRTALVERFDWSFGEEGPFWELVPIDYVRIAAALLPLAAIAALLGT